MAERLLRSQDLIAIDPGGEHCGVAIFVDGMCRATFEKDPASLYDSLRVWEALYLNAHEFPVMVVEEFKLYPGKATAQSWSTMPTAEVIGVLRERCRHSKTEFVTQPASIKKATRALVQRRGIALIGTGGHARDAELHGWHYLLGRRKP
jgi:hypothetical protein